MELGKKIGNTHRKQLLLVKILGIMVVMFGSSFFLFFQFSKSVEWSKWSFTFTDYLLLSSGILLCIGAVSFLVTGVTLPKQTFDIYENGIILKDKKQTQTFFYTQIDLVRFIHRKNTDIIAICLKPTNEKWIILDDSINEKDLELLIQAYSKYKKLNT